MQSSCGSTPSTWLDKSGYQKWFVAFGKKKVLYSWELILRPDQGMMIAIAEENSLCIIHQLFLPNAVKE